MRMEEYLDVLTEQICCEKARAGVREEIGHHIEDQKEALLAVGWTEEEAEREAVRQMGDPVGVGVELDQVHRPQMNWAMIALVSFLSVVGLLVQYLLSVNSDNTDFLPDTGKEIGMLAVGLGIMIGVCRLDYTWIEKRAKALYLIAVILFLGMAWQGGAIWIIYLSTVDTAVMSLVLVPLYGAILYRYRGQGCLAVWKGILWMSPVFFAAFLHVSAPFFVITGSSCMVMLSIAVGKGWFRVPKKAVLALLWGGAVLLAGTGVMWLLKQDGYGYIQGRIQAWLHPFEIDEEHMYGRFVPEFLVNNRWFGMNELLNQDHWVKRLPAGNDYTLAYVSAYYGIFLALILVGLMALLFLWGLRTSLFQKNQLGMMMGTGCAVALINQFVFYLLCNTGLLPSGGIYCPFITHGGSGRMVTYALLGIILSVYRYQNVLLEKEPEAGYTGRGHILGAVQK